MKYLTSHELATKWNISQRRILRLASEGKIEGAKLYGKSWIFPEHVQKPLDGRTKYSKTVNLETDNFRYPLFEYKDESSFHPPLSKEEKNIKAFVEAFHAFNFSEAENILNSFDLEAPNKYIRICELYCKCMLSIFQCNTVHFLDAYGKLKSELSVDFPHKAEMSEYLYEIDSVLGEDEYYSFIFHKLPAYNYDLNFLPRYCNLSALYLALNRRTITPLDLAAHEANCAFLDQSDNVFDSQAVHLYLACAYNILGKEKECFHHFYKALELAQQYKMFYTIASMQYYYTKKSLDNALKPFSKNFQDKIKECNNIFHSCHIKFTNAMQMNSLYKHLTNNDYLYIVLAEQGLTNKEVADRLKISLGTVGKHYGEIYAQFGVHNKSEMISLYNNLIKTKLNK